MYIYICMSNTHLLLNVVDNFAGVDFSNQPGSAFCPSCIATAQFLLQRQMSWPGPRTWTHGLGAGQGCKTCFFFQGFCSKLVGHWSVNRLIRYGLIEYIWILLNIHPPEMTAPLGDHSTNIEWLLVISNKWHQISIFQPSWVDYTSRSSRSIFHSLFK